MHLQSKANFKLCTNLGGALAYHILLKATMFLFLLSFVEALIYMLSSITKKGEIESATITTKKDTSVTFWAERIFFVILMTLL